MDDKKRAGPATPTRSSIFSQYIDAMGATIKSSRVSINPNGSIFREEPLQEIPALVYSRQTSPLHKCNCEHMQSLTITYKRFDYGVFPVAVSALEKENNRTHIITYSIRFDPQAPNYNRTSANSLLSELYQLEKKSCMDMAARLAYQKAVIFEYSIDFSEDSTETSIINTLGVEPYLESVFSSRYYDDEKIVSITWEDTEAGWLPVISSIDETINHGFLITIPKSRSNKRDPVTNSNTKIEA